MFYFHNKKIGFSFVDVTKIEGSSFKGKKVKDKYRCFEAYFLKSRKDVGGYFDIRFSSKEKMISFFKTGGFTLIEK